MPSRGCLCDQPTVKTLGTESLISFSGWQCHTFCCNWLLGGLSKSCVTPLGEESPKFVPGLPQTWPRPPFPFADCALHPFAGRNHSSEYNYMLSPVSPPSESSNLGMVGGNPHTLSQLALVRSQGKKRSENGRFNGRMLKNIC